MGRVNCWEYKRCERQPGGRNSEEFGVCPAARDESLDGIHEGANAGRACWVVAGTMGEQDGTCPFARESRSCWFCDFFSAVRERESATPLGFSASRLSMKHTLKNVLETDHLSRIAGIGNLCSIDSLRDELKRTTEEILGNNLGGKKDVFLRELDNLSARKPSLVVLVKDVSKKVYLMVDDQKAPALERALLGVIDRYL